MTPVAADTLVETAPQASLFTLKRAQETELPAAVKLSYLESGLDYRLAAVEARHLGGSSLRDVLIELPGAVGQAEAQKRADVALQESWAARETAELALPPSTLTLEPGDVMVLGLESGPVAIRIEEVADGAFRKVRGRSFDPSVFDAPEASPRALLAASSAIFGKPNAIVMDLPVTSESSTPHAPWIAATARPWPGSLAVYRKAGPASFSFNRLVSARATMGTLQSELVEGPLHVFDRGCSVTVKLSYGALASVSAEELLQGANAAAVGTPETGWEIIQFANAELVGARTYRLSMLLRGQSGSNAEMLPLRSAGQRFVLLNRAVVQPALSLGEAGLTNTWRIGPSLYDLGRSYVSIQQRGTMLGLRPLSPCQARAIRQGGDVLFTWIRRTRFGGDSWDIEEVPMAEDRESYLIEIAEGTEVRRTLTVSEPHYLYPSAAIAADFGADPGAFTIRIAQLSAVFGAGATLQRTLHV